MTERITTPQIQCGITRTTPATHDVIRANVHRSPMYSGQIKSSGPRYCPSIEDKIVRFGDRDGHQIFLEPEGLDDTTVYPNGISTSLPEEVQLAILAHHSRPRAGADGPAGLCHRIRPCRPARARSDACRPSVCRGCSWPGRSTAPPAMKRRRAQGLVAGLNAALAASGADADRVRSRRRLSRRDDRRSRDARHHRAVPDVHLAGRVPADLAGRQRRSAPDRQGDRAGLRQGRRGRSVTAPR